ncbi:MAG: hypothetical protein NTY02_18570, partial [Acidobacteria bacterium]|nr:hypothetical protein [Acidobacteriota bacterium]
MFRKLVSACALSLVLAMLCPAAAAQPPSNVWRSSGPYGGAVAVMAASPMNSQTVYAGTHGGGLYRSIDGGLNWVSVQTSISDI